MSKQRRNAELVHIVKVSRTYLNDISSNLAPTYENQIY